LHGNLHPQPAALVDVAVQVSDGVLRLRLVRDVDEGEVLGLTGRVAWHLDAEHLCVSLHQLAELLLRCPVWEVPDN